MSPLGAMSTDFSGNRKTQKSCTISLVEEMFWFSTRAARLLFYAATWPNDPPLGTIKNSINAADPMNLLRLWALL